MELAISNPSTGKITGAKKGSFEYYHEEAHLKFQDSNFGMNIQWFGEMSQFYTIISLTLSFFINFFKYVSVFGMIIMIFCFSYEEIWCNYTAKEKLL